MAIIYNQNIGINYRGILNLDATTINTPLDATLRAVTDGAEKSSCCVDRKNATDSCMLCNWVSV